MLPVYGKTLQVVALMTHNPTTNSESDEPMVYQIRLKGQLGAEWAGWFEGLTITLADNGDTLLTGLVLDQAALFGLLRKVRDLGMTLLSVLCVCGEQETISQISNCHKPGKSP